MRARASFVGGQHLSALPVEAGREWSRALEVGGTSHLESRTRGWLEVSNRLLSRRRRAFHPRLQIQWRNEVQPALRPSLGLLTFTGVVSRC